MDVSGANIMEKRVELWDGWVFDGSLIYDNAGNHYTQKGIEQSFFSHSIINDFAGSTLSIMGLKKELRKRVALVSIPRVCFIYETPEGVVEKVFDLNEV